MNAQKLLVIVAFVCLMAFLSVSPFAQTAQAADPARVMPRFVAQTLRAAGLAVQRDGNELTVEEQIVLEVPFTLQDWEDSGIRARLVRPLEADTNDSSTNEPSDDDLVRFAQFRQCLNVADFVNQVRYTQCELNPTDVGDFVCKTRVLLDHVFDDLNCIFTYICTPENNFCA